MTKLAAVLTLLGSLCLFAADKKPVTIDALMNQHRNPMPTPIWSPDGKRFAIVNHAKVTLYDAATGASVEKDKPWFDVAALSRMAHRPAESKNSSWRNRRVSNDSFQWSSNSKDMLAAVEGDLFLVHHNGKVDQLTRTDNEEEDPKLSPDGEHIVYRSQGNLYLLKVSSKKVTQLTGDGSATLLNGQLDWVYPEELDLGTAAWWSPDSKKVAFMQFNVAAEFVYPQVDLLGERAEAEPERYPQAGTPNAAVRIGVIDIATGAIKWMDLGETAKALLARVEWLPDSQTIAVERLSRVQDKLELLFCDAEKGSVHQVLKEESKTWINFMDNFFPVAGGKEFLWTNESGPGGFRHIYRYSSKGELLKQVTEGAWEVSGISAIDDTNRLIYFVSSQASPLESQYYSVSFDGGAPQRITKEEGSHTIHANGDSSAFVDIYSNVHEPPQAVLKNAAGQRVSVLAASDKSAAEEYTLLPSEMMQVKAADGTLLYGRLIKPADYKPGVKYPLIVEVYGGPGVQTVRDQWYGLAWDQVMAQKGYMVFALDNRGSSGRGHAFETPIYRELGTQEVADQRAGVEHLIKLGLVDASRVGITGWSYGGYLTVHSMLLAPDVFKVGVAGAPVTDWHNYDTIYTERYMGIPDQNSARYDISSNVHNAEKLQGRLLILHNFEDDNVLFQNTMQLANALEQANRPFYMQIYPQKTHGVSGPLRRPLDEVMTQFFDDALKR